MILYRNYPSPFECEPLHPNFLKRAKHHDYRRPAMYMITMLKSDYIPVLSDIRGNLLLPSAAPVAVPTPTGSIIEEEIVIWEDKFPQAKISSYVIMPDHIHLMVNVWRYLPIGLGRALGQLKGAISRHYHQMLPEDVRPMEPESFFTFSFNDRIARDMAHFDRMEFYINDNPRRLLMKRENQDIFYRRWEVTIGGKEFIAVGNIFLLRNPELMVVRFSRKYTEEEFAGYRKNWERGILNGATMVSPFIHGKEKEVRDMAFDEGGSVIRICENGFSDRFAPQGREFDYMGGRRLLLLGPKEYNTRKRDMTYAAAQEMNKIAEEIVRIAMSGERFHLRRIR